jgi:hypothetical protein
MDYCRIVIQFLAGIIQSAALEANHSSQRNVNADMDARAICPKLPPAEHTFR